MRRLTIFAALLCLVMVAAGTADAFRDGAMQHDYLADLTENDMVLALRDRGIEAPISASRRTLVRMMRESDAALEAASGTTAAAPAGAAGSAVKVKVLYCMSWGYRNAFVELANALRASLGDRVVIEGDNYPVEPARQFMASVASTIAFLGFIACMVLPNALPEAVQAMLRDNKMMVYGGLFILYQLGNGLLTTGAFEVEVDGAIIFSKIQSGNSPNLNQLFSTISGLVAKKAAGAA